MNDAELNLRIRVNRFDGFGETFESVNAGDEKYPARLDSLIP